MRRFSWREDTTQPGTTLVHDDTLPPVKSGVAAMPSNDVRTLLQAAVPTVAAGAIAAVVSGVLAGGKGVLGAVVATLVVTLFMGIGLYVLQRTANRFRTSSRRWA
ncbi:hypothetical protein SFUMM280S_00679 [Streptomyces fumanus]